jgi:hypothetical protein
MFQMDAAQPTGIRHPVFVLRQSPYAHAVELASRLSSYDPVIYAEALGELRDLFAAPQAAVPPVRPDDAYQDVTIRIRYQHPDYLEQALAEMPSGFGFSIEVLPQAAVPESQDDDIVRLGSLNNEEFRPKAIELLIAARAELRVANALLDAARAQIVNLNSLVDRIALIAPACQDEGGRRIETILADRQSN